MIDLKVQWPTVEDCLKQFPGMPPAKVKNFQRYLEEGSAKKGVHFFLIEFTPGEVVMPKGVYSDYAAVLLEGAVRVYSDAPPRATHQPASSCWRRRGPWRRGLANWVLDRTDRLAAAEALPARGLRRRVEEVVARCLRPLVRTPDSSGGGERTLSRPHGTDAAATGGYGVALGTIAAGDTPFADRVLGVTSVVWNLPRSVTLVAGRDAADATPSRFLMIKRYTLKEIIKESPAFYQTKMEEFVRAIFPHLLGGNQLFRNSLYIDDVAAGQWPALAAGLRGDGQGPLPEFADGLREMLSLSCKQTLQGLPAAALRDFEEPQADPHRKEKYQVIKELNQALKSRAFYQSGAWPPARGENAPATDVEYRAWNLRLFDAAFPGMLRKVGDPHPLGGAHQPMTRETGRAFINDLIAALTPDTDGRLDPARKEYLDELRQTLGAGQTFVPLEFEEGDMICKAGDPSDAIYFILTGKFRVSRPEAGGSIVVNNLESQGYFGESCITEGAVRTSSVEALTRGVLVALPAAMLRRLIKAHPAVDQKLRSQRQLVRDRDLLARSLDRVPPRDPPQHIAGKLLRATNLLLIDMEKCTRCDQCVRSCGEAHDDVPRFHRANPELRFGKWEVAGACLHCVDAPCQSACPVGAITLLDNRAVQIHRDRCIGCTQCAFACPFHVIDMYKPAFPEEAPGLSPKKPEVATKCDLCLTANQDPPCVVGCPYDAAHRGAPEDFFPGLVNWAVFHQADE